MCGFTRREDLLVAIEAGVDAIGLNFYPSSPRYVEPMVADELIRAIERRALVIGVFVNEDWDRIQRAIDRYHLDAIQLHGNELPDELPEKLQSHPIIKAMPWRESHSADISLAETWAAAQATASQRVNLKGFLIDAYDPIHHGGTGRVTRWDLLYPRPKPMTRTRLILAGGITPENVAQAISIARPDAIDTASGIEYAPGIKCPDKMRRLIDTARPAFSAVIE